MPPIGEIEQSVELSAIERAVLAGALHLDEPPFAAHHDIHVDVGAHVFLVVEIEPRLAIDDADAHRRDAALHRRSRRASPVDTSQSNASTTATHAPVIDAVRVPPSATEHVAIELDRELAELEVIEHRANAAADQPLNLLRAPAELRALARRARPRRARQHRVLGGHPAFAAPRRQPGTPSSTDAVQSTRVAPNEMRHEPSAYGATRALDG